VLGFASGLPFALCTFSLRLWLSGAHVALTLIALTTTASLPYTLKFLWAPLFDAIPPAFWGRRRFWLLVAQIALLAAMAALALCGPATHERLMLGCTALLAFCSASQDILIDAWRIESFPTATQGTALAAYVWGYRAALLVSGAGVIALSAHIGWRNAYLAMLPLACLGPIATLFAAEPPAPPRAVRHLSARFRAGLVEPLVEFCARPGAALIIAYILLFPLGDALSAVMLAPYYTHLGFDRAAIAVANGPISLLATLMGAAAGAFVIARLGLPRALIATGFFQTAALLMYPALGLFPGHPAMLVGTAWLESFSDTFAFAAFLTYLSTLTDARYTATQYALISSLPPLALHTIGGATGAMVGALGFIPFYTLCAFAALPGMAVLLLILRYHPPRARAPSPGS
jgi:PAT family beta-lactamase induction signal transducer AmpG